MQSVVLNLFHGSRESDGTNCEIMSTFFFGKHAVMLQCIQVMRATWKTPQTKNQPFMTMTTRSVQQGKECFGKVAGAENVNCALVP